jgi:dTDP-4-dehydrorhamnose 3,5-epimerase
MKVQRFDILGPLLFTPKKYIDDRGYFMETFRYDTFCNAIGKKVSFVQDNQSFSTSIGTLRGLHYQSPPFAQGKLVRCTSGSIIDVAVDIRKNSKTFGKTVKVELSPDNAAQLWVPEGFLHGFLTLKECTEVQYKCTNYYSPDHDGNIAWDDPELSINWGIDSNSVILSEKDKIAPEMKNFINPF